MPTGFYINRARSMATTSLGIAIASLFFLFTPALSMGLAPLGVIVALLSRDETCKFDPRAKIAIGVCIFSFVVAVAFIISGVILLINEAGGIDKLYDYLMLRMKIYGGMTA